jgi:hypothetical protein
MTFFLEQSIQQPRCYYGLLLKVSYLGGEGCHQWFQTFLLKFVPISQKVMAMIKRAGTDGVFLRQKHASFPMRVFYGGEGGISWR